MLLSEKTNSKRHALSMIIQKIRKCFNFVNNITYLIVMLDGFSFDSALRLQIAQAEFCYSMNVV